MSNIPYGRQSLGPEDYDAVRKVLLSDFITQGPMVNDFEKAICEKTGARFAIAVSSGTSALHLACMEAGLGKGHRAITSPITFIATSNAVLYCGAKPILPISKIHR